jgi:superfamily II DNA or RNA helicase/ribosomal protein S27E
MPPNNSNHGPSRWGSDSVGLGHLLGAPSNEHFELHLAAIEYELASPITIRSKDDIQSKQHWSDHLEPFEHQIQNLITFCRRAPVALFADDVGLGKTISAGLVLNELQSRKKVKRALVLCRKSLHQQWKEELEEKFGIQSVAGVGPQLLECLRGSSPVVITTYDSARDRMDRIQGASFDMLILDEAHRLRNLFGTPNPPAFAKVIHEVLQNRHFKYVLMLTATPIQNRLWDMYSLIHCLSAARGHNNPLGQPKEFLSKYVADGNSARVLNPRARGEFRSKVQEYMVRTSRNRARLVFPKRHVQTLQCEPKSTEKLIQTALKPVFEESNSLTRNSLAEALMSSPRALLSQLRKMQQTRNVSGRTLEEAIVIVERVGDGCKLDRLREVVEAFKSENPKGWRILVFSKRLETVGLIAERLRAMGVSTGTIRGGDDAENQKNIVAFRTDPPQINALISSDAGAEGLNLQVCNVVINYDLPWNPMVLEQRIGRVQRLMSPHKFVEVLNLTVKGSVEDRIVARLISKLQAVSETIGDVEAIVEASDLCDEDGFEEELRSLVTRALMGQDVEEALRLAQESIDRAKAQYEAEKQNVENTLGGMDDMHRTGAVAPDLAPTKPRFGVREFCLKAFLGEGWRIEELSGDRLKVYAGGQGTWEARFGEENSVKENIPAGTFGGPPIKEFEEGSRAFEGLLGEWRKRFSHRILDRTEESEGAVKEWVTNWGQSFSSDIHFKSVHVVRRERFLNGRLFFRANAWVSHDRFEKICDSSLSHEEHGVLPDPLPTVAPLRNFSVKDLVPEAKELIQAAVESDPEIKEFVRFYEARQEEEIRLAGDQVALQSDARQRFEPQLASEVVGGQGDCYLVVEANAEFTDPENRVRYEAQLIGVPLSGRVLSEPDRDRCDVTQRLVPADWLGTCSETRRRVLKHFLDKSDRSGAVALASYLDTCGESGKRLLKSEMGHCEATGKDVDSRLLGKSEIGGRRALKSELLTCEITGVVGLPDEMEQSGVSGRRVRKDQMISSERSGIRGHATEMVRCAESRARIAPSEGAKSDYSGRFVARDFLVASEKGPGKFGLPSEMVTCQVTGRTVLMNEAVQSVISGAWVETDHAICSDCSKKPMLPSEAVRCEASGATLLPTEIGRSEVSGKRIDLRLLKPSDVSGRLGIDEEFRICEVTEALILADEGFTSAESGKFVRSDQSEVSVVSGSRAHRSEMVRCAASGAWMLRTESQRSDYSGLEVDPALLRSSEKPPGRRGLESELRICAVTARKLLLDEGAVSAVSGSWGDQNLLVASPASGARAFQAEMVACQQSGILLLPSEVTTCSVTGQVLDLRRTAVSEVSGLRAAKDQTAVCEITGSTVLKSELIRSAASGRMFRADQIEASSHSGAPAHVSELVVCADSGGRLLPSEAGRSSVSDRVVRKDLLIHSEKNPGRCGLMEETMLCEVTGRRLLADEAGVSAASGKRVDLELLVRSEVSDSLALESEMVVCEESGVRILPSERAGCAVTGKRVHRALLVESELTGRVGLKSKSARCEFSGKIGLEDEMAQSAASGKVCFREFLEPSAMSGNMAHAYEMVVCSHTGDRVLPSESVASSLSGRPVRSDSAVRSERQQDRIGLPSEIVLCAVTGKRLLADEVTKSELSGAWIDSSLAAKSGVSGRICLPSELVRCEETQVQLLPDEREECAISHRMVDRRILVASELSGRRAVPSRTVRCEFTGATLLEDEAEKSIVSGKLCRKDILEASAASGSKAHPDELVRCLLSGDRLLPSEASASSISGRIGRHDLVVRSDRPPGRVGFPEETRICSVSAKRLLMDEVVQSEFSGKWVDSTVAMVSGVSARKCLPEELVVCEESGVRLLPDETAVCGITGRRVDRNLLSKSALSGREGIARLLSVCPESLQSAFPRELERCEVTGLLVDPARLETCTASGKRMLRRLMVQCSISERWVHRELAFKSSKSGRWGHPDNRVHCHWTGQTLLPDEVDSCRITGITFDREWVHAGLAAIPLVELLHKGAPKAVPQDEVAASIAAVLGKEGIKAKAMHVSVSPSGECAVFFVDCSGLFGLRKRQAVGFCRLGGEPEILGKPATGLLVENDWIPEGQWK